MLIITSTRSISLSRWWKSNTRNMQNSRQRIENANLCQSSKVQSKQYKYEDTKATAPKQTWQLNKLCHTLRLCNNCKAVASNFSRLNLPGKRVGCKFPPTHSLFSPRGMQISSSLPSTNWLNKFYLTSRIGEYLKYYVYAPPPTPSCKNIIANL